MAKSVAQILRSAHPEPVEGRPQGRRHGSVLPVPTPRLNGVDMSHPMRCISTRAANGETVALSDAIAQGLAPDGGLYVPVAIPAIELRPAPLPALAATM